MERALVDKSKFSRAPEEEEAEEAEMEMETEEKTVQ